MEQKILTQIESRNTIFHFFIKLGMISIIKKLAGKTQYFYLSDTPSNFIPS